MKKGIFVRRETKVRLYMRGIETSNQEMLKLESWASIDANVSPEYNVKTFTERGKLALEQGIFKPEPTIYLMEKQHLRPMGNIHLII